MTAITELPFLSLPNAMRGDDVAGRRRGGEEP